MGGGARFFVFFNAADSGAIGAELYYQARVGSFRDSIRVLRESILLPDSTIFSPIAILSAASKNKKIGVHHPP